MKHRFVAVIGLWLGLFFCSEVCLAHQSDAVFSFAAAGDMDANEHTTASLKSLKKTSPDFFVAVGDLSYNRIAPEGAWCDYVKEHLGSNVPMLLLSGNHESDGHNGLIENFIQGFGDPFGVEGEYAKQYFFDYPKKDPIARFICVSPDLTFTHGGYFGYTQGTSRLQWLNKAIDDARKNSIDWIFVFMHKNCLSAGVKSCEIGSDIMNLMIEKKVDLIIQGHDHTYQRSWPLIFSGGCHELDADSYNASCVASTGKANEFQKGIGPILLISGAFGAPLYAINDQDKDSSYFVQKHGSNREPIYGYNLIDVSKQKLRVRFIVPESGLSAADDFTISEK